MKEETSPNLIRKKEGLRKSHPALYFWGKILAVLIITVLAVGLALSFKVISSISTQAGEEGEKISFFQQLGHLITRKGKTTKGEENDRINILLLGMGGPGHQGSLLTDTIILASLKPSTKQVAFLSIPRDLAVEFPENYYWRKINNAIVIGRELDYPGGGEALMSDIVADITGLDIHYYGRVDFAGFAQVIDGLGGLEIKVERSFTDYQYPTYDYGYQTVSFKAGEQIMDGETALKYVRSRHGNNNEGSDFARAKRQQKVLVALKDKITAFSTLINPKKISDILSTLGTHTRTNMEIWEMLRLYNLSQNIDQNKIITKVIDNSPDGLLKTEVGLDGAYILVPEAGNFSEIQHLAQNIFNQNYIEKEGAKIAIENGTSVVGLAKAKADELTALNYNIVKIGNYSRKDVEETIIYDITSGQAPYTVNALREKLKAQVYTDLPLMLETFSSDQEININSLKRIENLNTYLETDDFDILIILGEDSIANKTLTYY